ncbi:GNAT family N-acetyltransferase [Paenibacillus gansuensis]|uniref:GNAT family N-acetyltransferase n=1 Tax=Paenibacillus gansuensis TaxID=306542 RepID=A0ABW5PH62_9BACL
MRDKMEVPKEVQFVTVQEHHLPVLLDIYNHYVRHTTVSFHTEPLDLEEFSSSVIAENPRFQTFVIESKQTIIGYVLTAQHKKKQAYDSTAEVTLYLDPGCLGRGVGTEALHYIEQAARRQQFHSLIATVCVENERSIRLFERQGYVRCALFREVGSKFGRRLDIASYQKLLRD